MKKKSLNAKKKIHKKLLNYLKNPLISKIFRDFENFLLNYNDTKSFAVAVSGGADSLALTYLSKCFSILNDAKLLSCSDASELDFSSNCWNLN